MKKEKKEDIKRIALGWGVAIIFAIVVAIICLIAAHSQGVLQVAHAVPVGGDSIGNIIVARQYAVEQYITPTGDCDNAFIDTENRIAMYYQANGNTVYTQFKQMNIEVNTQQGICLLQFNNTNASGAFSYSKRGNYWAFNSWYISIDSNAHYYSGNTNEDISLEFAYNYSWNSSGTNATNAQGTLESILGFGGNDAPSGDESGGESGGETPTPTLSPTPLIGDSIAINVNFMADSFPYDSARSTLYAIEVENAAQHLSTPTINSGEAAMPLGCYMRISYTYDDNSSPSGYYEMHTGVLRCAIIDDKYYLIACVPDVSTSAKLQFADSPHYTSQQLNEGAYTVTSDILNTLKTNFEAQDTYGTGFNEGYTTGYNYGKQAAENLLGVYAGMDLVTGIFAHIGDLLNTPIIGSIPIYVFILIPLILGVVYVVLKFVR